MAGTGPQYLLCAQFGVPAIHMGVGNADSNNHGPNENIVIADYVEGLKHMASVFSPLRPYLMRAARLDSPTRPGPG